MKPICIIFLFVSVIFGCKKGKGDFFSDVQIHYVDSSGKDLFRDGQKGYYVDSVRIYQFLGGNKTAFALPNKSLVPFGYFSPYFNSTLVIYGLDNNNNDIINHYTVNIIHLKPGVDDTLKIHLTGNEQMGSHYDGIWYNGVQYPATIGVDTITVVKRQ